MKQQRNGEKVRNLQGRLKIRSENSCMYETSRLIGLTSVRSGSEIQLCLWNNKTEINSMTNMRALRSIFAETTLPILIKF